VRTRGPFWALFQTVPVLLSKEKLITEERFVVNVRRSPQRERGCVLFENKGSGLDIRHFFLIYM